MEKIDNKFKILIFLRFLWNIFAPVILVSLSIIDVITEGFPDYIKNIYLLLLFMFIGGIFFYICNCEIFKKY